MVCAIWYHLYNLKSVKNTRGGVFLLVKLRAGTRYDSCLEGNRSLRTMKLLLNFRIIKKG